MSAVPGLPPAWPRRRRVAGFARGSASGGAVPIPVKASGGQQFRQTMLDRALTLPGVDITPAAAAFPASVRLRLAEPLANGPAESFIENRDFAIVTAGGDILVRLPAETRQELSRAGWAEDRGRLLRVAAARRPAELEVMWRILLCAYEYATGTPADPPARRRGSAEQHFTWTAPEPAATGMAV